MAETKISIVMPWHNGMGYIKESMESVLNQTLREFELICVDDASTDGTFEALMEYAKKDSRIKVILQEKADAGTARNRGFEQTLGKYVLFLDSDDLYEPELLERMFEQAEEAQAEVCVCNADQFDNDTGERMERPQYLREDLLPEQIPFSRETIGKYCLYFTTSVPWNKLIKRSFLVEKGIRFQQIPRANDQYFSIMVLMLASKITVVRDKLVHYRVSQKNNLTTRFSETPLCAFEAMCEVVKALEQYGLLSDYSVRQAMDNKILNLMLYSLNIQNSMEGYRTLYDTLKKEGFARLGFMVQEEDYYFNPLEYRNLCYLMQWSCEEYLLYKNIEYRGTISGKNELLSQKNAIIRDLRKKEGELNYIKGTKRYKLMAGLTKIARKILRKG